jgi:hypothetical protein
MAERHGEESWAVAAKPSGSHDSARVGKEHESQWLWAAYFHDRRCNGCCYCHPKYGDGVPPNGCVFFLQAGDLTRDSLSTAFSLMRKLDIHNNKAQLVQYAIQKKIIQIPTV